MKPFALFLFFAAFVFAAPSQERRDLPLYPNDDPFYNPPSGFELEPLGSIIRSRPKTNPFGIIIVPEILKGAYQLMVRSEDTAGNPSAIIVTVFVPFNADPSKLISYQIAEDSANGNCAPLYALQLGSDPAGYISSQVEQILVQAVLAKGYYVVVPDYGTYNSISHPILLHLLLY